MWNFLKPSTQKVISLAAEAKALENDKERLRINLHRAKKEVKLLFVDDKMVDEENKRVLLQYQKERIHHQSGGKKSSNPSAKLSRYGKGIGIRFNGFARVGPQSA